MIWLAAMCVLCFSTVAILLSLPIWALLRAMLWIYDVRRGATFGLPKATAISAPEFASGKAIDVPKGKPVCLVKRKDDTSVPPNVNRWMIVLLEELADGSLTRSVKK